MSNSERKPVKKRVRGHFVASGFLLAAAAALMLVFSQWGQAFFPAYRQVSCAIMGIHAAITGVVPFSLWDFGAISLAVIAAITLVRSIFGKRLMLWVSSVCMVACAMVFFAIGAWGLNHYAPPLSQDLQLEVSQYSDQQLLDAAKYYWAKAAEYSEAMERDAEANLVRQNFYELAAMAPQGYELLAREYSVFEGPRVRVKALLVAGDFLLHTGHNGIFMPFTGECNVPINAAIADMPFTMCHELAHRYGLASEQEANFAGCLACWENEDARFRYSGYFAAFRSCYRALAAYYPDTAQSLVQDYLLDEIPQSRQRSYALVLHDMVATAKYYDQFNGVLEEVGTKVNDTYLKAFNHEAGIRSYGQVVDYLIAWYMERV